MALVPFTKDRLALADADPSTTEGALIRVYRETDTLKTTLDQLAIQVEKLVRERAQIASTLATFYRAEVSISSVQPVLDLAVQLTPSLTLGEQLALKPSEEPSV